MSKEGLYSCAMWKDSCCPKKQRKRCCFCFTHYWVPVALFPILLGIEVILANTHEMYESMLLPACLVFWYLVLLIRPRAQCSRLALFITLVVTTTLSFTAWGGRFFMTWYEEGTALYGICFFESDMAQLMLDMAADFNEIVSGDDTRRL